MSRQLEQDHEDAARRRQLRVTHAADYGIRTAVEGTGRQYLGFACRDNPQDVLLVIKAVNQGNREVAFVGGSLLGDALLKAFRTIQSGKVTWRPDKYGGQS